MFGLTYLKNVSTLRLDAAKCTGCRMCTNVCPHHVFEMNAKRAQIVNLDGCMECGACARNCPEGALAVMAGVGCAAAVINSAFGKQGGSESCCCCADTAEVGGCC